MSRPSLPSLLLLFALAGAGCSDHRLPDGLVPPPRPPRAVVDTLPMDVARWRIHAAGAEALGDRAEADLAWGWVHTLAPEDLRLVSGQAAYLTRTGRPKEALALLDKAGDSPLSDRARGEALVALGRLKDGEQPLRNAAIAGDWEAWAELVDAHLAADHIDVARAIVTTEWIAVPTTTAEALARAARRNALGVDATDDWLAGVPGLGATPADGLRLVADATASCRLREARAAAAKADWAGRPEWAEAVHALDAATCTPSYAAPGAK